MTPKHTKLLIYDAEMEEIDCAAFEQLGAELDLAGAIEAFRDLQRTSSTSGTFQMNN